MDFDQGEGVMDLLAVSAIAILALMVITWTISLIMKDASIVDIIWGLGFVVSAVATFAFSDGKGERSALVTLLVIVWGLRLSIYLARRNLGKGEDYRYQAMREKRPDTFWIASLFRVFLLQGVLMWVVSFPITMTNTVHNDYSWIDAVGVALWCVGLFFESVGDFQLARFKSKPESVGKVMDRGLWRYTRHPNYFGDFCVWWGLYLLALSAGFWWTIFSPIVMSTLLLRVSGVAMLEKTIGKRRAGYEEYVDRTNAFFPGPRKKASLKPGQFPPAG
jgi:steroid 5-alpha reductase family enzyme